MIIYQIGGLITGEVGFGVFTVVAFALVAAIVYLLFRKGYKPEGDIHSLSSVAAAAAKN